MNKYVDLITKPVGKKKNERESAVPGIVIRIITA